MRIGNTSFFLNTILVNMLRLTIIVFLGFALIGGCSNTAENDTGQTLRFKDVTTQVGFDYEHGYIGGAETQSDLIAGGVAAGDYNNDGWVDIYAMRGDIGPNLLFRNMGDGTFKEVGALAGLDVSGTKGSGPTFVDIDGDGFLDLFIGGVENSPVMIFRNLGNGVFSDITESAGIFVTRPNTFSAAFGDYDLDGDLDLLLTHWSESIGGLASEHLWRNNGNATFMDVSEESGIASTFIEKDFTFTPNFVDINNDGLPDILLAADFLTSTIFHNQGDGNFVNATTPVFTDENGMGAAIGDYDNDGDLDFFVSSIYDPNGVAEGGWGVSGNRLYRNMGNGIFEDATDESGVRQGYWGWGSCFADLNNDGHLDLIHVNGFGFSPTDPAREFFNDPTRLFISNGDGTFTERSMELGLVDTGQGRGILCFDYDRDGDIDIFVSNNQQSPRLFRNDGGNSLNFINIKLIGLPPNTNGVGARILLTSDSKTQIRELRCGSNFVSQNPVDAHFGLGDIDTIDNIQVLWPDGETTNLDNVVANQFLVISHPQVSN